MHEDDDAVFLIDKKRNCLDKIVDLRGSPKRRNGSPCSVLFTLDSPHSLAMNVKSKLLQAIRQLGFFH